MWKTCIKCGTIIPAEMGSRRELHPKRWRSGSTREWSKTRERILARDGFRYTVHVRPGERCEGDEALGGSPTSTEAMRWSLLTTSYEPSAVSTTRAVVSRYLVRRRSLGHGQSGG
jgi:hypothetical protein